MEPSALAGCSGPRRRAPGTRGLHVATASAPRTVHGAVVGGALAASVVGLLGAQGGLLWILGGVWTVRAIWGRRPGVAWGLACLAGAVRWGTLSLADIGAASRLAGPAVATEPLLAAAGATMALVAAVVEEAQTDGLRDRAGALRVPAGIAIVALAATLCTPGAGDPITMAWWAAAAAGLTVAVLVVRPVAARLPSWVPVVMVSAGLALVGIAR